MRLTILPVTIKKFIFVGSIVLVHESKPRPCRHHGAPCDQSNRRTHTNSQILEAIANPPTDPKSSAPRWPVYKFKRKKQGVFVQSNAKNPYANIYMDKTERTISRPVCGGGRPFVIPVPESVVRHLLIMNLARDFSSHFHHPCLFQDTGLNTVGLGVGEGRQVGHGWKRWRKGHFLGWFLDTGLLLELYWRPLDNGLDFYSDFWWVWCFVGVAWRGRWFWQCVTCFSPCYFMRIEVDAIEIIPLPRLLWWPRRSHQLISVICLYPKLWWGGGSNARNRTVFTTQAT